MSNSKILRYYYEDPNYYDWVMITPGVFPDRLYAKEASDLLKASPVPLDRVARINPPPDANPEWYVGKGLQWRKEPVRQPELMREGVHGAFGAFNALLVLVNPVLAAMLFSGFIVYEVIEGLRLKDHAYRDVGGALVGVGVVGAVLGVLKLFGVL